MRTKGLLFFSCLLFLFPPLISAQTFTDVASSAGISHTFDVGDYHFGGGASVIDYNNDGFQDIYLTGGVNSDALYRNNGDGTFTNVFSSTGITATDTLLTQGAIAGDINNDGYRDLFITVRGGITDLNSYQPNLMYLNNGDGTFTNISTSAGFSQDTAFSTSATFFDYNQDGFIDLYVGNYLENDFYEVYNNTSGTAIFEGMRNLFYINNGDNTFTEIGEAFAVADTGHMLALAPIDYDNDDDLDLYVANDLGWLSVPSGMYRNEYPVDAFTDARVSTETNSQIAAMGVAVGDYDEDGFMDMYITNMLTNILYHNDGDGTFTDSTYFAQVEDEWLYIDDSKFECLKYIPDSSYQGVDTMRLRVSMDSDTNIDTLLAIIRIVPPPSIKSDTFGGNPVIMYVGKDRVKQKCISLTGADGQAALVTLIDAPEHGNVSFAPGNDVGSIGWGTNFFDFDHDTDIDLFVANGTLTPFSTEEVLLNPNSLYRNDRNGTFASIGDSVGINGNNGLYMNRGSVIFDYDNDGDQDLLVVSIEYPDHLSIPYSPNAQLYRNDNSSGNWLKMRLEGTTANRDALGSRVRIVAGGRTFLRDVDGGGSSFLSSNTPVVHFGLDNLTTVDTLEIRWMGGSPEVYTNIPANQFLYIVEGAGITPFPIEILSLRAEHINEDAILNWTTASERNSSHFEVERSLDGTDFEFTGQVRAAGYSNISESYQFIDPAIGQYSSSTVFYRLKMVDLDGSFEYSNIVELSLSESSHTAVTAYPNPTGDFLQLSIKHYTDAPILVRLFDSQGRQVLARQIEKPHGQIHLESLDVSSLPKGVYTLLVSGAVQHSQCIVKQ